MQLKLQTHCVAEEDPEFQALLPLAPVGAPGMCPPHPVLWRASGHSLGFVHAIWSALLVTSESALQPSTEVFWEHLTSNNPMRLCYQGKGLQVKAERGWDRTGRGFTIEQTDIYCVPSRTVTEWGPFQKRLPTPDLLCGPLNAYVSLPVCGKPI